VIASLVLTGCAREDAQIRQHHQAFESLGSTMAAIDEAWLAGHLSGTFTVTALEQTRLLVEKERTALAASPTMLADPRGAELSRAAERLSRTLADTARDVRDADADAVRRDLAHNPLPPSSRP
jgi:adenine-specific DNA methylase